MENKTSKYFKYAIGEIILVVIGILIALSINNWNEVRKESIEEQKILKAIQAGFKFNKLEINKNIDETTLTVLGTGNVLNANLDTLTNEQSNKLVRKMTNFSTFHPSDGALNDLINSGHLNIIKNDSLKDKLSNWNSLVLDVTEDEIYMKQFINDYILPIALKNSSINKETKFKRKSLHLFNDPLFENIVLRLNKSATYQISLYKHLELEIDAILKLLKKEIN